jgi:acyl-coenzyme A synthetase/AMP-(fatty) acid ligase
VGTAKRGQIHILDQDGHELPAGQPGRIYFAGSAAFAYHGAPDKTLERTHPLGWQTLGDIGVLDDEGYLTLTDRADDMIISGGVNIYPQEIESALMELPGVLDCGVVGMPDAGFGERPHAFVVPTPAAAQDAEGFRRTLEQGLRERIGRLKLPAGIHLCAEMPRSATGKLLRKELPALAREPGS